ncbi:hypothetical protein POX_f08088 [Penicillium oxalicum]|uniref:hypothetical protein n=1 Tax=Penicillium oxalicum TaxID=69781 RepID=UPI0020B90259|nr:hypothetical protein POX_f08088 [Penicillium oxalicum]KAI2787713.1 hypothetical protein POX_f08088 [Penicillium oxalicum]
MRPLPSLLLTFLFVYRQLIFLTSCLAAYVAGHANSKSPVIKPSQIEIESILTGTEVSPLSALQPSSS